MTAENSSFEGETDIVLVAGVMRTGQTWLCILLAHALNARFVEPYCLLRGVVHSGNDYVRGLAGGAQPGRERTQYDMIVKTHERPDPHFSLTKKVIVIVRDPRDTITSAALRYRVMTRTGSDIEEDAQRLSLLPRVSEKRPTIKDRLWRMAYRNRQIAITLTARRWHGFYAAWRQLPFVHIVRYEDLVCQPVDCLAHMCRFLGTDLPRSELERTAHVLSMKEISAHQNTSGDTDNRIEFRRGVIGDFKNHLSKLELSIVRHYCANSASQYGYQL